MKLREDGCADSGQYYISNMTGPINGADGHKMHRQALRTGNRRELDPLVTELDPDAPNRKDDGKGLASDDAVCLFCLFMTFG